MLNFARVKDLEIPEGKVKRVSVANTVVWSDEQELPFRYVSFGDSIAVGHRINGDWEKDYGWDAQYGVNGRVATAIVPNCYTDLIHKDLTELYGSGVSTTSFARSGDKVTDLMDKLNHAVVRKALSEADYVTICIGANDVLHYALVGLPEYLNTGDLSTIDAQVSASLSVLNNDNSSTSYLALFNKLISINSKAKYVFTTVYNPYKYLWVDGSKNGFFKPLLDTIPQMSILGFEIDELIKEGLLDTPALKDFVNRVNGISAKAEGYVTTLNTILRNKITAFQATNPNFLLADTKALFDSIPDREGAGEVHYNDLVNVEYTRGYDVSTVDWGALWEDSDASTFWWNLATKYVSLSGLDISGFASELKDLIITRVVEPDIDPHPEEYGHYALKRSFADTLGWESLKTITYNANGGVGSMMQQKVLDRAIVGNSIKSVCSITKPNAFAPTTGYYFTKWNKAADGSSAEYSNGQSIYVTTDITLYAQWSNIYTVTVRHSEDSTFHGSGDTGPMESYALWIDGAEQPDLGAFSNGSRVYRLPYGTPVGVIAATKYGSGRSYITLNGTKVAGNSNDARYTFLVPGNVDIHFEWNYWLDGFTPQSYWNCYITTS
jgi:lysophospholipase L1-like esterase